MPRLRWVQIEHELIEVDDSYVPPSPDDAKHRGILYNDRIYQDANDPRYFSRTSHREYMKRNGLTTYDDFDGHFKREERKRAEFLTTGRDETRIHDVIKAVDRHTKRK